MKDTKRAIRYIGFECMPNGERSLSFTVDKNGLDRLVVTFDIAGLLFSGEHRILIQEAAGICFSKLQDMVSHELSDARHFALTADDIVQYRHLRAPRMRSVRT